MQKCGKGSFSANAQLDEDQHDSGQSSAIEVKTKWRLAKDSPGEEDQEAKFLEEFVGLFDPEAKDESGNEGNEAGFSSVFNLIGLFS